MKPRPKKRSEIPQKGKLSLGAALGQIIASYRDGEPKACAEALVSIIRRVESLTNQLKGERNNKR